MNATFTGKITHIFDMENFTTRDGRPFSKRKLLLESEEQYPQRILVTLHNDLATAFSHSVGDIITAHLSFDVSSNQDHSRHFNEIRCWRID